MGCCVTNDLTDIRCSNDKLISSLFPDGNTSQESSKRMITTATAFKSSLNELVNILLVKVPHYVRCVKSKDRLAPATFDMELCRHQIRYLGLLENVRVRRAGLSFVNRMKSFWRATRSYVLVSGLVITGLHVKGPILYSSTAKLRQKAIVSARPKYSFASQTLYFSWKRSARKSYHVAPR
jgi:myosin heavy subunit